MAITTSYAFKTVRGFSDFDLFDNLTIAGLGSNGYVYGGEGAVVGTRTTAISNGNPAGNASQTGTDMAIATLTGGNYVVATQDADSVRYQIFAPNGAAVTASIDTNEFGSSNPSVAALQNGGFVLAAQKFFGGSDYDIIFRFYNSAGVLQPGGTSVSASLDDDRDAAVAVLENGNVAIAFTRTLGGETEIWTAIYSPTGAQIKAPSVADTSGTVNRHADITAIAGGFAVAYEDNDNFFEFGAATVHTFDLAGNSLQSTQVQSTLVSDAVLNPSIARLSNGQLAVGFSNSYQDTELVLLDAATLAQLSRTNTETSIFIDSDRAAITNYGLSRIGLVYASSADAFGPNDHNAVVVEYAAVRVLTGGSTNEVINALADMDHRLEGNGGNDTLNGNIGDDELFGGIGNDTLNGGAGNDLLDGFDGTDILNGGTGADRMQGGKGNDTYTVDDTGDVVVENLNEGTDTVNSSLGTYTLTDNVEKLVLLGSGNTSGYGNALANTLTGNSGSNVLFGYGGNDIIDGRGGADLMVGGAGNDTYTVDDPIDIVAELAGEGTDAVNSTAASYTLTDNVEKLTLLGTANINGTGSAQANTLIGNSGNNVLDGGAGNDILDGLGGADTLIGGSGNDTYTVDEFDTVIENLNGGTDTIKAGFGYVLGSNFENLTLTGVGDFFGQGNSAANTITGNAGGNLLLGLEGRDTLRGGAGFDTLIGGIGADTLTGGANNDDFYFDVLETSANKDTITDFSHADGDAIVLYASVFTALPTRPGQLLTAAEFGLGAAATTADQRIIYNQTTGALYYDADGSGSGAQVQIALLGNHAALTNADIYVI